MTGYLIRIAALTDLLIQSLERPNAEHLSDDVLVASLHDLRERIELELQTSIDSDA